MFALSLKLKEASISYYLNNSEELHYSLTHAVYLYVKDNITKFYEYCYVEEGIYYIDIEENGKTFTANSLIKVRAISKYIKDRDRKLFDGIILADDSGLCVDALDGFPGVETHRFLGKDATDEQRNEYILEQLKVYLLS